MQVLLAMNANVEDRGSKGDCTPLMEAANDGFVDIVRLLLQHHANVNAQSSSGMPTHFIPCLIKHCSSNLVACKPKKFAFKR